MIKNEVDFDRITGLNLIFNLSFFNKTSKVFSCTIIELILMSVQFISSLHPTVFRYQIHEPSFS